jgi:hypothetical protein
LKEIPALDDFNNFKKVGMAAATGASPGANAGCLYGLGKTPMLTFLDAIPMTKDKMIAA